MNAKNAFGSTVLRIKLVVERNKTDRQTITNSCIYFHLSLLMLVDHKLDGTSLMVHRLSYLEKTPIRANQKVKTKRAGSHTLFQIRVDKSRVTYIMISHRM